jgi:hypothetical protein
MAIRLRTAVARRRTTDARSNFAPTASQLIAYVSILDSNPENQRDKNDNQSILNQTLTILLNYQAL